MKTRATTGLVAVIAAILCSVQSHAAPLLGETGVIREPGMPYAFVFVDPEAVSVFFRGMNRGKDEAADSLTELFNAGRLYMVDQGIKVRVIDATGFLSSILEIRILEGEFEGRRGFVPHEFISEK